MKAAIVGGGVIGSGWAARFLLNGWDVAVFDPAAGAEHRLQAVLDDARRSLPALYDRALPSEGALAWCPSVAAAVAQADWIQESVPERLPAKHRVLEEIQRHAPPHTPVASSTSGFTPSELQRGARCPEQILVCHPFHPVYLLPLVEVVASEATAASMRDQGIDLLRRIGMHPLHIRKEIAAHVADRLLEAVWRESLWLIKDEVATTRRDRRRDPFRLRPAPGADGAVRDVPDRRRPRRHEALHRAVRPGPAMELVTAGPMYPN